MRRSDGIFRIFCRLRVGSGLPARPKPAGAGLSNSGFDPLAVRANEKAPTRRLFHWRTGWQ
jgi:hypothetical protein